MKSANTSRSKEFGIDSFDPMPLPIPATPPPLTDLASDIKNLQDRRELYARTLRDIDEVLTQIYATLHPSETPNPGVQIAKESVEVGRSLDTSTELRPEHPSSHPASLEDSRLNSRRTYNKMPLTGREFVLDFIAKRNGSSTLDINRAWRAESRGGVANNVIGRLLTEGKIVREPQKRGSMYRLNSSHE